jgi:gliding motility-associated-like protein
VWIWFGSSSSCYKWIANSCTTSKWRKFCGLDLPTIQSLSNNNFKWNCKMVWCCYGRKCYLTQHYCEIMEFIMVLIQQMQTVVCQQLLTSNSFTYQLWCNSRIFYTWWVSPNGDGVTILYSDIDFIYPNYVLEIFNRYGSLMYTANKNKPRWDGTSSDSKQVAMEKRLKEFILCYSFQ